MSQTSTAYLQRRPDGTIVAVGTTQPHLGGYDGGKDHCGSGAECRSAADLLAAPGIFGSAR